MPPNGEQALQDSLPFPESLTTRPLLARCPSRYIWPSPRLTLYTHMASGSPYSLQRQPQAGAISPQKPRDGGCWRQREPCHALLAFWRCEEVPFTLSKLIGLLGLLLFLLSNYNESCAVTPLWARAKRFLLMGCCGWTMRKADEDNTSSPVDLENTRDEEITASFQLRPTFYHSLNRGLNPSSLLWKNCDSCKLFTHDKTKRPNTVP